MLFQKKYKYINGKNQNKLTDSKRRERICTLLRFWLLFPPMNRRGGHFSEKASLCASLIKKASIAVETALVLPLFFLGMVTLISFMDIYKMQSEHLHALCEQAKEAGIPVISYDRLIKSDAVSYYISFDNYTVGTLQGQYVVDSLDLDNAGDKTYNIEFTAGDPADNNAGYFFNGAFDVLKPYIDAGTLNVVSGQTDFDSVATPAWDTQTALERMQNILASYYADGTQLDVALCSNDSTALGVTQAIESDYAGDNTVLITGQDGDEANLANIVDGKQSMTVYKAVANEAVVTLDLAKAMLAGDTVDESLIEKSGWDFECAYDTESYETSEGNKCPSFLLVPTVVTKDNLQEALVDPGYYTMDDDGYLHPAN